MKNIFTFIVLIAGIAATFGYGYWKGTQKVCENTLTGEEIPRDTAAWLWNGGTGVWHYSHRVENVNATEWPNRLDVVFKEDAICLNTHCMLGYWKGNIFYQTNGDQDVLLVTRTKLVLYYDYRSMNNKYTTTWLSK